MATFPLDDSFFIMYPPNDKGHFPIKIQDYSYIGHFIHFNHFHLFLDDVHVATLKKDGQWKLFGINLSGPIFINDVPIPYIPNE